MKIKMKLKVIFLKILFFLLILTGSVFAKGVPPGSGQGDVPANILILLDASGSMGERLPGGTAPHQPHGIAWDATGEYMYVAQIYQHGVRKIKYSDGKADTTFYPNGDWKGDNWGQPCTIYTASDVKVIGNDLYVSSYYIGGVYRFNLITKTCEKIFAYNDWSNFIRHFEIVNNILYSFTRKEARIYDLSNDTRINCPFSGDLETANLRPMGLTVDHTGENLYIMKNRDLFKFQIGADKCPATTQTSINLNINNKVPRYGREETSLKAHPTNSRILYATMEGKKLVRITLNATKTVVDERLRSSVDLSGPRGLSIDTSNNNRIAVVEETIGAISFWNPDDLTLIKRTQYTKKLRMDGAHEAIKAIVTDSSLASNVNFGFGYWMHSQRAGFKSWTGDLTTGTADPCRTQDCIKVRAHKAGAPQIDKIVTTVRAMGGTYAPDWANQAKEYYLHPTLSPIDKNLDCQNSYVLVIGDGSWVDHDIAKSIVTNLRQQHNIKTFTVAYGGGIGNHGISKFQEMAEAGGTNNTIVADDAAQLKSQLQAAISQVIANKLSFSAPAITASIEEDGALYQAQFDYVQNQEWQGTLMRTKMNSSGKIDLKDADNWDAAKVLKNNISSRKIWTVLRNDSYETDYNNFKAQNSSEINNLFELTNNTVGEYHSKTTGSGLRGLNTIRCASAPGVLDGKEDDIKGLINFIRGQDYFDYDADCKLTEARNKPMGDIYHSELVVVGAPSAESSFVSNNQEAYWRSINNYDQWKLDNKNRTEMIYVGANDGLLHAFNTEGGKEEWAFVPPLIAQKITLMVNPGLNRPGIGGSNAIFAVDGSLVVHDMFFKSAHDSSKKWHTILFVPYGRGGAGFSVLDVTAPKKPLHLFSVLNDRTNHEVIVMDHIGNINSYEYIAKAYPITALEESIKISTNVAASVGSETCDDTLLNRCYKSKIWTFPVSGLKKADLEILKDGKNYTNFTVKNDQNNKTIITFGEEMFFYGYNSCLGVQNCVTSTSNLGFYIKSNSIVTGVQNPDFYDYSRLGETWSAPRIFRLPTKGRNDTDLADDKYVAVMGAGFGVQHEGTGSGMFVIDLEDTINPGKIEKFIEINDTVESDIVNSVPASPIVITPDTTRGLNFRGALVYTNDFEGKITKINLTNMPYDSTDPKTKKEINLYDTTTLFTAGSTSTNGRYMYHSMDASIGESSNALWLYAGTGDYDRIADRSPGVENFLLGIKDEDYPFYKNNSGKKINDITECADVTKENSACPDRAKKGWYVVLKDFRKVTAEPTIGAGLVYFPVYKPSSSVNACTLGDATICGLDDECGNNISSEMGVNEGKQKNYPCKYVGQGVLSKIILFGDKAYANIAGTVDCDALYTDVQDIDDCEKKKDLVQISAAVGEVSTFRSSWRHNY